MRGGRGSGGGDAGAGEPGLDPARLRWLRRGEPRSQGRYVLYWMQSAQRARANEALTYAVRRGDDLGLPVVVYQGLNPDYPQANARIHRFVLEGARDTARTFRERGIPYVFGLRRKRGARDRTAVAMMRGSALTVVDDFPAFILPRVNARAVQLTADLGVPIVAFDGNGVVPLAEIPERQYAARTIRPRIHRRLLTCLRPPEEAEPSVDGSGFALPASGIEERLADASDGELDALVASCDVDPEVLPSLRYRGGREAGLERLEDFVSGALARYHEEARDPGANATSGLSPYLHFGHLDAREVALRVRGAGEAPSAEGGAPPEAVEAYLEQLVVRRELAYNFCRHTPVSRHTSLKEVPEWAQKTMEEHEGDERPVVYTEAELEEGRTHDPVWNAAQAELVATGTFHGYLRMLWGKNVIRWTRTYAHALRVMVRFHHRYALDGRNPNTYANLLWCFGLHDRAFAERPVLGKLRPLSSERTRRKHGLDPYFARVEGWAEERGMGRFRASHASSEGA